MSMMMDFNGHWKEGESLWDGSENQNFQRKIINYTQFCFVLFFKVTATNSASYIKCFKFLFYPICRLPYTCFISPVTLLPLGSFLPAFSCLSLDPVNISDYLIYIITF